MLINVILKLLYSKNKKIVFNINCTNGSNMSTSKSLASALKDEQKKFIDSFDTVLLDMDGVIWLHFNPIAGAVECIENLKKIGKKVHYVTNNSLMFVETILERLNEKNFQAELSDVVTPHTITVEQLKKYNVKDDVFVLGTGPIKSVLKGHGYSLVPDPPALIEETVATLFSHYDEERKVGAIVFDVDFNLSYLKMQKAFWYLRNNPECVLFITLRDKAAPVGPKGPIFGMYHFVEALVEMSGKDFIELGKPSQSLVDHIINTFEINDPNRVLFIGDSIQSDMATAAQGGFQKLLVLSGTDTIEDINHWKYPEEFKPQYYAESLAALNEVIKNLYGSELKNAEIETLRPKLNHL